MYACVDNNCMTKITTKPSNNCNSNNNNNNRKKQQQQQQIKMANKNKKNKLLRKCVSMNIKLLTSTMHTIHTLHIATAVSQSVS